MEDEEEKKAILIVDDDPLTVTFIKGILTPYGYDVFNVSNGKSCMLALKKYSFDLIIMDMLMPIYDGNSATIDIKHHPELKNIPVVAISASDEQKVKDMANFSGADHFFSKPFKKDEFVEKVSSLIYDSIERAPDKSA